MAVAAREDERLNGFVRVESTEEARITVHLCFGWMRSDLEFADEVQKGAVKLAEWRLTDTFKAVADVDAQVRDRADKT